MLKIVCISLIIALGVFLSTNLEIQKLTAAAPISISSGGYHTCALLDDGKIKCWGFNGYGQLGHGDTYSKGDGAGEMGNNLAYVDLGINGTAKSISSGLYHTCALLNNGEVKCWGSGNKGQLGQGTENNIGDNPSEMGDNLQAISLGTSKTATQISAGHSHTCALLNDGDVKCWGDGHDGRLGQGNASYIGLKPNQMGDNLSPINLGENLKATSISAGGDHTCALLNNGQVKCWGANNFGQLGIGSTVSKGSSSTDMGDNLGNVDLGTGLTAKSISVGRYHSCAILDDNSLKCWGLNTSGQLGQGSVLNKGDNANEMGDNLPNIKLGKDTILKSISLGFYHTCALFKNNKIKCWGAASSGQLGQHSIDSWGDNDEQMGDSLPIVDIDPRLAASSISIGAAHSCTLVASINTIKCWGSSNSGQLGQGNTTTIGDNANEMGDNLSAIDLGTDTTTVSTPTAIPANSPTPIPEITTISDTMITPVAGQKDDKRDETAKVIKIVHPNNSYMFSDQSLTIYLEIPKYSSGESYQMTLDTSLGNCEGTLPSDNAEILKCAFIQIYDYLGNPTHNPDLWQNLTLRMILLNTPEDMPAGYVSTVISALRGDIRLQGYTPGAIGNEWIDLHNETDRSENQVSFVTRINNNRVVGLVRYGAPQTDVTETIKESTVAMDSTNKSSLQSATPIPTSPTLNSNSNESPPDVGGHSVTKLNITVFLIIGIVLVITGFVLYHPKISRS